MHAAEIARGAPTWVYVLLIALIILGVRRLKARETPVLVALIPSTAFLVWSIVGATMFAGRAGIIASASAWLAGGIIGGISGIFLPEPRGEYLPGRRVRQAGSWLPLVLYLGVFSVRFACGAWAAMVPSQANTATAIGIAAGAAVMMRLLIGVARWRAPATAV